MNEVGRDGVPGDGREVPVDPRPRVGAPSPRVCPVLTKAGTRCPVPPLRDAEKCFAHDDRPQTVVKRDAARRAAGLASYAAKSRNDLTTLEGQKRALERVIRNMEAGLISQKRGEVLVRAFRAMIRVQRQMDALKPRRHVVVLADYAGGPAGADETLRQPSPSPSAEDK